MSVAEAETQLLVELATGAAVSAVIGGGSWAVGHRVGRDSIAAFGRQTLAWAAVDAALAAGGALAARRRGEVRDSRARARLLRRVLLVNAGLDLGYIAGGAVLALRRPERRGDGVAIMVQGRFLLWLDARHARRFGALAG